jgi:hypothetical protein
VRGNGRHGCPPRGEGEDVAPGGRRGLHGRANMMMDRISISTDGRRASCGRALAVSTKPPAPLSWLLSLSRACAPSLSPSYYCPAQSDLTFVFQRSSTQSGITPSSVFSPPRISWHHEGSRQERMVHASSHRCRTSK